MNTLTKQAALEITIELWTWLSENPTKHKSDWPGWTDVKQKYNLEYIMNYCACCEYASSHPNGQECENCPLIDKWTKEHNTCEDYSSPYCKWTTSINKADRTYYALEIVKIAKEALEELNK